MITPWWGAQPVTQRRAIGGSVPAWHWHIPITHEYGGLYDADARTTLAAGTRVKWSRERDGVTHATPGALWRRTIVREPAPRRATIWQRIEAGVLVWLGWADDLRAR